METTPLDGYKKIIITLITIIAGSVGLFITDPSKAQSVGQFLIDVIGPVAITLVGIIYTIVQGSIDKEKVKAAGIAALPPKANGAASLPAAAPMVNPAALATAPAAPPYVHFDIGAAVGAAEEQCRKDGVEVNPISRAFYFYPMVTRFDLREVPRTERVSEAKRLVDKAVDLFCEAFKYQTKLPKPPTQVEAASYHTYMAKLKKDYEKANGLTCSDTTFEQLRNLISYFNEIYAAQDGLAQLQGKTVDFSIYGSGAYTATQVGWDYVKLL
jgi:DNA-binding cell septation regulator SpoVG